jgi:light-regulated signal transduction histidine kinase (bacteriophytochrome)
MTESLNDERDIKSEFQQLAYMIVHHLKEPARAIRTGAELLLEQTELVDGDASVASCADRILRGVARLDDITGSIARYADDLGNEGEPMEDVNAGTLLRSVRQKLQPLIEQTGATVTNGHMPVLRCQPSRFSRLLENLLRNAVLYRRELPPAVHISAEEQSDAWLFSIKDNGTGMAPTELERIFDPFSRLSSKGYKGLGMGLTAARRIVAGHGGRIWAESELGVGSTISFTVSK